MTRKFKFFLFFIIFLFILFVLGAIRVEKKMQFLNERTQQHESIINELNSKNIIEAVKEAKKRDILAIGFIGNQTCKLREPELILIR